MPGQWIRRGGLVTLAVLLVASPITFAQEQPGQGVTVQPVKSSIAEETFQTLLVSRALEALGFEVKPIMDLEYDRGHVAVANGEATFMANHWDPLHTDFYEAAGGDDALYRKGTYSPGALQGYLIDRETARQYDITNIQQLKDPKIARLFDDNGDGRADLVGCPEGWGCEQVIEHHLDAYDLRDTVSHRQGIYSQLINDTIERFRDGQPVLYYTWTPYWVSAVMEPGDDVLWLEVPFSSLPGKRSNVDTSLPDGTDYGFQANNQRIIANQAFADENPSAARLFEIIQLSANDISNQNLAMRNGENRLADIRRHTSEWIESHRETFNQWLEKARAAAQE
ncbi:glycine betaine/proline transport system substrate-binding protein [Tamilnaduibacter salinus]|uniref:Glycine betaine/proline transport system substrate-binding protein n=1 Tax=Tamilnaduibacter salinus TaxID=1484056 RepID=A0A2U1CX16_9GAMM|nr:glycine betaine/L-proline ABC transporter substrate-binding protein ProX [Tamilnaduibacter salinus]PVY76794.1 glycine betaine/proline transport system substrate-binding protein [Tamilnaduibacter salinus]